MLDEGKLVVSPRSFALSTSGDEGACAQLLTVWNDSSNTLAFKIKSNAPRRFFVRPNNGVLPPGRTLEVDVSLQPASAEHLTAIVPLGSPLGGSVAMSNAFDGTTYKFIVLSVRIDARCAMDEGSLATLWTRNEPRVDTVLHCSLNDDPGSPARRRAPPRSPLFSRANSVGESEAAEPFRTRQSSLAPSRERTPSQARRELLPLPVADDQPQPFSADGEGEPRRVPPPPAAPAAPASPLAPPRPHAKAAQGAEARAAQVTRKLLSAPTLVDDWPAAQPRARAGTEGAAASTPPGGADGAPPPAAPAFGSVEPGSSSSASPQPSSQPAQPWSQPHHLDRCAAEHTAAAGGGADGGGGGSSSVGSSASAPRSPAQRERMLPLRTTLDLHQPLHGSPAAHVHSPQLHGAGSLAPIGQRQRSWGALNALSQLHGAPAVNSAALRPSRLPSTASELGALGGSGADSPASSAAQLDAAPAAPFRAISPTSPAAAGALRDELRVTRAELERTQQALQRAERARLELRAQCGELRAQLRAALPQPAAAADGTLASSVAARLVLAAVSLACALLAFLVGLVEGFLVGVVQGMLRVWDRGNRQELHSLMVGLVVSVLITRALV